MFGPLYARATYGSLYPEILSDSNAEKILEKVRSLHPDAKEEFLEIEKLITEFLGLNLIIRASVIDDAVREFIRKYPTACIVNLGCGLDNPFPRVDNGKIMWYNLDLPDTINYRLRLIPETDRTKTIAKSVFDTSWFTDVDYNQGDGIFFFAGGVFGYFPENEVSDLFHRMAEHFQDGEIYFDAQSNLGNRQVNRRMRKRGFGDMKLILGIGNPDDQLKKWSDRLKVLDWYPFFSRMEINSQWSLKTRLMMKLSDAISAAKFIHCRFMDT
jgi:O-methyltransferase involved in polyketide biosynthesis